MSIVNKIKRDKENLTESTVEVRATENKITVNFDFSLDELEFLIRLIGSSNFKGNDLMFIYDLVNKLQNLYLDKKGVQ